ncbi:hypothetical protein [Aestuariivirga sp.]|uniref:hypothetical protein n=1 Tax=Aestuariivirga sp. TaxID=2650926 RepID=UPI0035B3E676
MTAEKIASADYVQRLTPLVRFGLEFRAHAEAWARAGSTIYDDRFVERLSERAKHFQSVLQKQLQSLARLDAALMFLLVTKNSAINFMGFELGTFQYLTEALYLLAACTVYFVCVNFMNSQGYETLIRNWCSIKDSVDGDHLYASYSNQEQFLTIYREHHNLRHFIRPDFYTPHSGFKIAASVIASTALVIIFLVIGFHLLILGAVSVSIIENNRLGTFASWILVVLGCTTSLVSLGVVIFGLIPFKFTNQVLFAQARATSEIAASREVEDQSHMGPSPL